MKYIISSKRDLRIWVDEHVSSLDMLDEMVDQIVDSILADDHPAYGTDWTEFLAELPNLIDFITD